MEEVHELPEEITVRIMVRLPTKSLVRFSCVSKRWYFLIFSDPHLAKTHFRIASQSHTLTPKLLFFNTHKSDQSQLEPAFESFDLGLNNSASSSWVAKKVICPFLNPNDRLLSRCSSNGLVCALFQTGLYVWNPATRFYKQLPYPNGFPHDEVFCSFGPFGFGYVSATDDYKVFANYAILSLKSNVWNKVEPPNCGLQREGTLLHESLHWYDEVEYEIVAFDLHKEEFRTMPLPVTLHQHFLSVGTSVGGCLCLLDYQMFIGTSDVWIMRDYNVADSWTKQFSVNVAAVPGRLLPFRRLVLVIELEGSAFVETRDGSGSHKLVRSGHDEEEKLHVCVASFTPLGVIYYQETLLGLP